MSAMPGFCSSGYRVVNTCVDCRNCATLLISAEFAATTHFSCTCGGSNRASHFSDANSIFESGQQPNGRWQFKTGAETKIASFRVIGPLQREIYNKAELTLPTGKAEISAGGNLSFQAFDVLEIKAEPSIKMEVDPRAATVKFSPDFGS